MPDLRGSSDLCQFEQRAVSRLHGVLTHQSLVFVVPEIDFDFAADLIACRVHHFLVERELLLADTLQGSGQLAAFVRLEQRQLLAHFTWIRFSPVRRDPSVGRCALRFAVDLDRQSLLSSGTCKRRN